MHESEHLETFKTSEIESTRTFAVDHPRTKSRAPELEEGQTASPRHRVRFGGASYASYGPSSEAEEGAVACERRCSASRMVFLSSASRFATATKWASSSFLWSISS